MLTIGCVPVLGITHPDNMNLSIGEKREKGVYHGRDGGQSEGGDGR